VGSVPAANAQTYGPPPGASPAAQSWDGPPETETWRNANGAVRSRKPKAQPRLQAEPEAYAEPGAAPPPVQSSRAPGASYPRPGNPPPYAPAPARAPQQDGYPDPAAGAAGPSGSSQPSPGEQRYDEIGYAGIRPVEGGGAADNAVVAVSRSLPANSVVEVTALDSGRTVLVLVTGTMPAGETRALDLSAGAARQLGYDQPQTIAVRVRKVSAVPTDLAALHAGRPAAERPDTPPVLLTALRKRLPGAPALTGPAPMPPRPVAARPGRAPAPRPVAPAPASRPAAGRFVVQVAALSNAANAQSLAHRMGGFVKAGGGLHRVQLGPFATARAAEAARAGAARAGYGDARVIAD
jgi:rare lipoprotein A